MFSFIKNLFGKSSKCATANANVASTNVVNTNVATATQPDNIFADVIGKKCLIRSYDAGVYFGTVRKVDDDIVLVEDVRNIWYWEGAACLSQIVNDGVKDTSKISQVVKSMTIGNVCQIMPLEEKAIENLYGQKIWKA